MSHETSQSLENDGYRMVAFAGPDGVVLQSRRGTNLTAAFPEIAEAAEALGEHVVLDGEVVIYREGRLDFAALQQRLHRSPRTVARLAAAEPAHLVCFDLLEHDGAVMISWPYRQRRAALVSFFKAHGLSAPWALTLSTTNVALARQWMREWPTVGVEGIVGRGSPSRTGPASGTAELPPPPDDLVLLEAGPPHHLRITDIHRMDVPVVPPPSRSWYDHDLE